MKREKNLDFKRYIFNVKGHNRDTTLRQIQMGDQIPFQQICVIKLRLMKNLLLNLNNLTTFRTNWSEVLVCTHVVRVEHFSTVGQNA